MYNHESNSEPRITQDDKLYNGIAEDVGGMHWQKVMIELSQYTPLKDLDEPLSDLEAREMLIQFIYNEAIREKL